MSRVSVVETREGVGVVGVVGVGVMGCGVSVAAATVGVRVIAVDRSPDVLPRVRNNLVDTIRTRMVLSGTREPGIDAVLAGIELSADLGDLAAVGLVVENVTERWDCKAPVYAALDEVCDANAIFCANTSAIPITRLASLTSRPGRVIGMHFMNPATLKPTVEVITGEQTVPETLDRAQAFLTRIGKTGVVVRDSPGFVTNRVMMLTVNEAIWLLHEGVASAADIDRLFVECFSHRMGPLATADLIGLDTVLLSLHVLQAELDDDRFRPCPLLEELVARGCLGRKRGRGLLQHRPEVAPGERAT